MPTDTSHAKCPTLSTHLPSGWGSLDALLGGGWPAGGLVEILGHGGTSLALGAVRAAQQQELPIAWIDGSNSFCPATASLDPSRLTWVRAGASQGRSAVSSALFAADVLLRSRAYSLLVLDLPARRSPSRSAWFRLARLAVRAETTLLLLHPDGGWQGALPERSPGALRMLAGSASQMQVDVRLRSPEGAEWDEWPAPELELWLHRKRFSQDPGENSQPLRLQIEN